MKPIHLRDAYLDKQALHFHYKGFQQDQLTDYLGKVTYKTCLRMLQRAERALKTERRR